MMDEVGMGRAGLPPYPHFVRWLETLLGASLGELPGCQGLIG